MERRQGGFLVVVDDAHDDYNRLKRYVTWVSRHSTRDADRGS